MNGSASTTDVFVHDTYFEITPPGMVLLLALVLAGVAWLVYRWIRRK